MSLLEESESLRIPFGDIKEATKNFTTLIGKGGYGLVYKGELLLSGKLTTVAAKRLQVSLVSGQGFKEFLTEIQLLTRYKHPNLISLVGFCNEGEEKLLIYEYAEHGSLDKYLSTAENSRTLTWKRRLDICVNAARGLNFLHNEAAANERVIHRDIKSANVLLDENWKAMISDLGLSKLGRANEKDTYLITNASGTYGYCDPVYSKSGILTKESDVYSFGVVLFEVLCGRLCYIDVHNESRFLPHFAKTYYKKGQINEIMDPELQNQLDSDSLKKFSEIAFKCIHNTRKQRPTMRWVLKKLEELKKTLDLQISEENNRKRKQHSSSGLANSTSTMMYSADETGGLASSVNRLPQMQQRKMMMGLGNVGMGGGTGNNMVGLQGMGNVMGMGSNHGISPPMTGGTSGMGNSMGQNPLNINTSSYTNVIGRHLRDGILTPAQAALRTTKLRMAQQSNNIAGWPGANRQVHPGSSNYWMLGPSMKRANTMNPMQLTAMGPPKLMQDMNTYMNQKQQKQQMHVQQQQQMPQQQQQQESTSPLQAVLSPPQQVGSPSMGMPQQQQASPQQMSQGTPMSPQLSSGAIHGPMSAGNQEGVCPASPQLSSQTMGSVSSMSNSPMDMQGVNKNS